MKTKAPQKSIKVEDHVYEKLVAFKDKTGISIYKIITMLVDNNPLKDVNDIFKS